MARSIGVAHLALVGVVGLVGLGGCSVVVGSVLNGKSGDGGVTSDIGVAECTSGPQCDDTNPCTADTCMDRHCVRVPAFNGMPCGAAAECNMGECVPCPGGVCSDLCGGVTCPGGTACRVGMCVATCDAGVCPDGQVCNAGWCEPCPAGGGCVPPMLCASNADCNDSDDCTIDNCDPPSGTLDGCTHKLVDADGDGFTPPVCGGADCDDANSAVNPGATEVCNGIDDDCDGTADNVATTTVWYPDADGDGYGNPGMSPISLTGCTTPSGYVKNDGDCDDNNAAAHPYPTGDVIPFFDVHRGDSSFDYDCDGFETKQYGPITCAVGDTHACPTGADSCSGGPGTAGLTTCGAPTNLYNCLPCNTPTVPICNVNTTGTTPITMKCH